MAWASSFNQDTDVEGLGTLSITYTDVDGNTTTYAQRCNTNNIDEITNLCLKTKSVIENKQTAETKRTAIINKILNEVNKVEITPAEAVKG